MYMEQVIIKREEETHSPVPMEQDMQLPAQAPKGRGRPRASYAQTGEFDVGLIREFRARPVLYDRSCKRHKDKQHVAEQWMQISHKLGYDVPVLKERMLNLRNRYNIEKRRIECGVATHNSQWPQFESLQFLANHIRSRRSFKHVSKYCDDTFDGGMSDSNGQGASFKDDQEEDEFDHDQSLPVTTVLTLPSSIPINSPHDGIYSTRSQRQMLNGNNANKANTNGRSYSLPSRQQALVISKVTAAAAAAPKKGENEDEQEESEEPPAKRRADESRSHQPTVSIPTEPSAPTTSNAYAKFHGFGEFMAHSLSELPLQNALLLVQKFTSDLVQSTIRSQKAAKQKECTDHGSDSEVED
ncbi:blast:Transcription factor Adf-1 [Drosophila guanche]|uniref:Blast:Transcription factor Adf-1 n=1 Tax=Drosophila guanche TaxID=7266 RepID=A0A3B0KIK4_DROGU|nr:blast:Transcription factor Adf-1 [Drosophila guanche]